MQIDWTDDLTLYRLRAMLVMYWIVLFFTTHAPFLGTGSGNPLMVFQEDKILHLLCFGGLCALLLAARPLGRAVAAQSHLMFAGAVALVYCGVDEITQGWTGREISNSDLFASMAGVLLVYLYAASVPMPESRLGRKPRLALLALWVVGFTLMLLAEYLPSWREALQAAFREMQVNWKAGFGWLRTVAWFVLTLALLAAQPLGRRRATLNFLLTAALMGGLVLVTEYRQGAGGSEFPARVVYGYQVGFVLALLAWAVGGAATMLNLWPKGGATQTGQDDEGHFVVHARLFAGLTLLSRLTGLLRDAVLAAVFGLSVAADAFFIGFLIPNLFRRLFGEGALSAAFIPHYTELRENNPALAQRFASLVLTLLTVVLAGVTLLGELVLWALSTTTTTGSKASMAINLAMVMLPYMPLVCLVAMIGGLLQVHKRFGPPAAASLILNGCIILAAAWAAWVADFANPLNVAYAIGVGVLVAGVLQLLWLTVVMYRQAGWTWSFDGVKASLRSMLIMMGPMTLGLGVFQINALLDSLIAFFLSPPAREAASQDATVVTATAFHLFGWAVAYPIEIGGVAAVQWAQRLYQFPLGVFGLAIATAVFPALAAAAAKRNRSANETDADMAQDVVDPTSPTGRAKIVDTPAVIDDEREPFDEILRQGLRLTVFIGLPASLGLILLGPAAVQLIYQRGAFTPQDTARVAGVLAFYAAGIWAYSMMHVLTRAFYACKDASTPLHISLLAVGLNFLMNMSFIWVLGVRGLALSTAISATLQVVLLLRAIRAKLAGQVIDRSVLTSWITTVGLTAAMSLVLLPMVLLVDTAGWSLPTVLGYVLALTAAGAGVVLAGAWWLRCEELRWLLRRRKG